MRDTEVTAAVAALEAACGHRWAVWHSDTGTWWAARTYGLTTGQISAGRVPFLKADNPGELAASIRDQDRADSLHRESDSEMHGHEAERNVIDAH